MMLARLGRPYQEPRGSVTVPGPVRHPRAEFLDVFGGKSNDHLVPWGYKLAPILTATAHQAYQDQVLHSYAIVRQSKAI
jgi:hypothetical protein